MRSSRTLASDLRLLGGAQRRGARQPGKSTSAACEPAPPIPPGSLFAVHGDGNDGDYDDDNHEAGCEGGGGISLA